MEPHYNLASVYLDQGRLDDAEKEYLKTLALRPGHFSSKIGLSSVYNRQGLYNQATVTLELAIKENLANADHSFALARSNLGELYGKTGKIENAITEWEAALKIDPSLLPAHFNLGDNGNAFFQMMSREGKIALFKIGFAKIVMGSCRFRILLS